MALFTIEQIELIRRLRNSGVTKDQVLQAFTELERLDAEFSNRSLTFDDQLANHNLEFSYDSLSPGLPNGSSSGLANSSLSHNVSGLNDGCLIPFKQADYFGPHSLNHCSSTNSSEDISESMLNGDCSVNASELPSKLENDIGSLSAEPVPHTPGSDQTMYNNSFSCSFFPVDAPSEELAELQELKKKGDMAILAEIRNFVMAYNIKQTLIAEMTKMSQPYVSRFFRGDIQDMPDRTKNVFFMWYLTCKNNPLKLEWPLSERDIVTLPVVNNWFNNRRKDAKKQMRLKHGPSSIGVQSPCQTSLSPALPMARWSPCSVSTPPSFHVYQDLSSEITESDSSSTSERMMDNDHNLMIDLQEQESCDVKQIL